MIACVILVISSTKSCFVAINDNNSNDNNNNDNNIVSTSNMNIVIVSNVISIANTYVTYQTEEKNARGKERV